MKPANHLESLNSKSNGIFLCLISRSLLIAALGLSILSHAQLQVKGIVNMEDGASIPFASVLLLKSSDSSLVRGQVSNDNGLFSIDVNETGSYFISVSAVGFIKESTQIFQLSKSNSPYQVGTIIAREDVAQLGEVVVAAERPMFEQKIDRTVINVQSNISRAGGTALDILQRAPGVTVDKMNYAIALSGKQGVRIMINGKISRLPMAAVVQMLAGMNAEIIERIELITTPPSKYEAEGDAGMINIVMKKMADIGTNGSLSLFTGYGRTAKYGGTLNVNHRTKRLNIFGDLTNRNEYGLQYFDGRWAIPINGQINETTSHYDRPSLTNIYSGSVGFDWSIGSKTTIGGAVNIFNRNWDMDAIGRISRNIDQNLSGTINMDAIEQNDWLQVLGNVNVKHDFNDKSSLSFDFDKIGYNGQNPTEYFQDFFDAQGNQTSVGKMRSDKDTGIDIFTSAIDFTSKISDNLTIELGAKGSFTSLANDIVVDNLSNGSWMVDNGLTSYATMYENIGAGYTSATIKATDKLDIQAGIRYEHTITNIDTRAEENVVDRNYGRWFPSLFVNHKINDNNSWVVSYSRRIARPSFFQLAPFVIFSDPNSVFTGNIALLPSFTDAFKMEYRHKSLLLSLQHSSDKNAIVQFQPRISSDNKQVSTSQNLDYQNNYSVVASFPIQVAKWWEIQLNGTGSLTDIRALYLDNPVSVSFMNYSFNGSQKFKISKTITAELSGFYLSKGQWGILKYRAFGGLDFGIEKKFTNSSLRVSYSDMLATNKWKMSTSIPSENLNTKVYLDWETTVATVTYSLNFGNNKLKGIRGRKGSSKEEQDRLK